MIKFSIVIITYNQHRLTERVLRSVALLNYDRSEYEIVLIDDGSIPSFSDAVSNSLAGVKYFYIPRSENSGRAKARNLGASKAIGEFIIFIDGDCIVNPDFLRKYEQHLKRVDHNLVLGTSGYLLEAQLPSEFTSDFWRGVEQVDPHDLLDFRIELKKINNCAILSDIHTSWLLFISRNFCVRRSLFTEMRGFDERFVGWGSEDVEFAYRLIKRNESFDLIKNKVFHLTGGNERKTNTAKYVSWVKNIGLFYSIHQDPCILLLMTQDKLIYNHFCLGEGWDHEHQISTFQALKEKISVLTEKKSSPKLGFGIVATIADCSDSIDQFIRYHIKIGFNKIYLFIDDNDMETYSVASRYSNVQIFMRDEALFAEWRKTETYNNQAKSRLIDTEVMVRQEMNFFVAYSLSKQEEIDWLVHLDVDELFFPNGVSLQDHFKSLQFNDYRGMTYLNYESISTDVKAPSIYLSSEYFKINFFRNKYWFFNADQKRLLQNTSWLKEKYFHYYQNGKSSVSTYGSNIRFYDVHSIAGDGKRKIGGVKDPIILHFPCARYCDFFEKYKRLGAFSDVWMGYKRAGDYIDDIHLRCRDVFQEAGGDEEVLMSFYTDNFVYSKEKIDTLIKHDLVQRITFHQDILADG